MGFRHSVGKIGRLLLVAAALSGAFFSGAAGHFEALAAEGAAALPRQDQDFEIAAIEINQALGVQKDNQLNFVAGKKTVVRAILSKPIMVDQAGSKAAIYRDGTMVAELSPKSNNKPELIVDFLCPSMEACGAWAAGDYRFNVSVNGKTKTTEGTSYIFKERKAIRILVVPVKANYSGNVAGLANDEWKKMWKFTSNVYPVGESKLTWTIRGELDASDSKYDLDTDDGQRELWTALTNLMPAYCTANPAGEGCYDRIIGFVQNRQGKGTLQGYTYGSPANIVTASDNDAEATVAHEVAHTYGIGDTYGGGSLACDINPAPDGMVGQSMSGDGEASCKAGKEIFSQEVSASKIPAGHHPYEIDGRGALGDMACYMGTGGNQSYYWTTQETYDHLFKKLDPAVQEQTRKRQATSQRFIEYFGYITPAGEIELEPWESFMHDEVSEDTTGPFQIQALDADGNVLATQKLEISFTALSNPPRQLNEAPFLGVIRFPLSTAMFQITRNGEVLSEVPVSANAPTVADVTPLTPMDLNGEYTIKWNAWDQDGDSLTYTVLYNPDTVAAPEDWIILIGDLEATPQGAQWTENFADLPGGSHARIKIIASDGILAGEAQSAEFTVPVKAPEVYIEEPDWGYSYEIEYDIALEADVYDLQDEWLTDDQIVWRSNLLPDQIIGKGSYLIVNNLPPGEHAITVTGTNRKGLSASDRIDITVGNIASAYAEYPLAAESEIILVNAYQPDAVTVSVKSAAVLRDTIFEIEMLKQPSVTQTPEGMVHAGRAFMLRAYQGEPDADEWQDIPFTAKAGVSITVDYAKTLPANIDAASLRLYRLDQSSGQWQDVAADCAPATAYDRTVPGKMKIPLCHFSEFALMGKIAGAPQPDPPAAVDDDGGDSDHCFIRALRGSW